MNDVEKMKEALTVAVVMAYENDESVLDALYDANIEYMVSEDGELPQVIQEFGQSLLDKYSYS